MRLHAKHREETNRMKQFGAFIKKEFYHIFRDKRTMLILLIMPIILIILFGYAITTEIRRVSIGVLDESKTAMSTQIIDCLDASSYFELYESVDNKADLDRLFQQNRIRLALVFPADYGSKSNPDGAIQLLADASDPNEATQLIAYATAIINQWTLTNRLPKPRLETGQSTALYGTPQGIQPVVHLLYNPQMIGAYNFVPGVMGLILILICALMASVGIVREKETGTMEVLLVSPIKPIYIILAKVTPYLVLSFINIATILALSYFLLDVPIAGSLMLLILLSVLYALVSLCLGILISTIADTQQAAMLLSAMVLMLPVILLSGMMFPIENMPKILQWLSNIVPAKWYIIAVKDIMIKGVGFVQVQKEFLILSIMTIVLVVISLKRFKIRL